ncbi:MAG: hypothetical protein ACJAWS_001796 [Oleiphilaceae bacterium]|jgi:uncharacterized protein YifE (UPF0438 family)
MSIESFLSKCNFYDAINFRHGFDRAGIFTKRQAEILTKCGYSIKQLELGHIQPQNEQQRHMLLVLNNQADPKSEVEMIWKKYLNHLNKPAQRPSSVLIRINNELSDTQSAW